MTCSGQRPSRSNSSVSYICSVCVDDQYPILGACTVYTCTCTLLLTWYATAWLCRETFERQKMDIRAMTKELQANKKALEPKVLYIGQSFEYLLPSFVLLHLLSALASISFHPPLFSPPIPYFYIMLFTHPLLHPPGAVPGLTGDGCQLNGECSGGPEGGAGHGAPLTAQLI